MSQQPAPALHPWEISPQDVKHLLDTRADFFFMDCRTADERETANIEGGTLMPMQELDLHADELEKHRNRMVVVYCRSGRRSMAVTTLLRDRGFVDVKSMAGGILRWSREIDPSIPQY
jgi:adenylyltransferase/sulfurtransferase